MGVALISWKRKSRNVFPNTPRKLSITLSSARSEIVWLWCLLDELGISQQQATFLHADNASVVQIAANPIFHEKTKHIEVDCHYIKEDFDNKLISLFPVPMISKFQKSSQKRF